MLIALKSVREELEEDRIEVHLEITSWISKIINLEMKPPKSQLAMLKVEIDLQMIILKISIQLLTTKIWISLKIHLMIANSGVEESGKGLSGEMRLFLTSILMLITTTSQRMRIEAWINAMLSRMNRIKELKINSYLKWVTLRMLTIQSFPEEASRIKKKAHYYLR